MKTLAKIFMIMILGVSLVHSDAFEKEATSSATKVIMSSEKPLTTGNNTIVIAIQNDKYKDSKVSLKIFMPAMPGMPYMESEAETVSLGDGKFRAEVNLAMSGTWQVYIFITPKAGKKVRVKSSINI
jgi:hypothetical protein